MMTEKTVKAATKAKKLNEQKKLTTGQALAHRAKLPARLRR